jgi:tetratricopeptide (TPR) repeat protein
MWRFNSLLASGLSLLLLGCIPARQAAFSSPKLDILDAQIRQNAGDAQAYSNRGYTFALLGRPEEARADLKKAVALKNTAAMHNRVGWAYFNLGDYPEALRQFEQSAKLSGFHGHYDYYSLVLGYWGIHDLKKALENYQLAVQREPKFGEYKTLNERTAEWTPLERRAIHEVYVLWSKTWKPN